MNSDSQLQDEIVAALRESSLDTAQIRVLVRDSNATHTGYVSQYPQKMVAEYTAKRICGVISVVNDIEVRLPSLSQRSDSDIAAAALEVLRQCPSLPHERVKVTVRDGWLALAGNLDWQHQKKAAERIVQDLVGLKGMENKIGVTTQLSSSEIKDRSRYSIQPTKERHLAGL